jgi:NADH-quinone oxidoreductase subunit F
MRILVGLGTCGIAAGAEKTYETLAERAAQAGATWQLAKTGCVGMCFREPIVEVCHPDGRRYEYGGVTADKVDRLLDEHLGAGQPIEDWLLWSDDGRGSERDYYAHQTRIVLRNCGRIDPESLDDYLAVGGYQALRNTLTANDPEALIANMIESGLRGRGGAGFPTGMKWRFARLAKGDAKYIICNADEGDPGAFMDRSVLESDPHAVLEGMAIAAFAIGAQHGYIYCRAEYPKALERLTLAIKQAEKADLLGDNVMGKGFSFSVRLKEGAGAFVCGEETALIASIEGKRGMPRVRPPFPATRGLWDAPTCINNVETLANVPWIVQQGGAAFAAFGTARSKGTKVFAMAGKIQRGGLVEVPMGISIRKIIFDICGGIKAGRKLKAVQMGGPSGGCIPAELQDTVIDYESINKTGAIMGSGGLVVMDDTTCMVDVARFFLDFTQRESCGKCTFCRIGSKRMLEVLTRLCAGDGREGDIELLEQLAALIKNTSLCALGGTAPNPVLTTLKYFRSEYEAHVSNKKCPAHQCTPLLTFTITDRCVGCLLCIKACSAGAISGERKQRHLLDQSKCTRCGQCRKVCNVEGAIAVD